MEKYNNEHLNKKMMSFEKLVVAIEELDKKGIISFEDFKALPYHVIQKRFFSIVNHTQIEKAKIKIQDLRMGKLGPSEYTEAELKGNILNVKTWRF